MGHIRVTGFGPQTLVAAALRCAQLASAALRCGTKGDGSRAGQVCCQASPSAPPSFSPFDAPPAGLLSLPLPLLLPRMNARTHARPRARAYAYAQLALGDKLQL